MWEYGFTSKHLGFATALIHGRYPDNGKVVNTKCEEIYFVLSGKGIIHNDQGDFEIKKDDSFFLAYTSGKNNLLLQPDHLDESLTKLPPNKFFRLDGTEESWKIINDSTTFRFNLSQLVSDRHNKCFSENLPISNPRGYSRLNPEQQRFLQVVGYTPENLEYLSIYFSSPLASDYCFLLFAISI